MSIEEIALVTICLESQLRHWKSQLFHEMKLREELKYDKLISKSKSIKEERLLIKEKKAVLDEYNKKIIKSEKYNQEATRAFASINDIKSSYVLTEEISDMYAEFTQLLIKATDNADKEPVDIDVAILKRSEKGNLFINNKKYEIIT